MHFDMKQDFKEMVEEKDESTFFEEEVAVQAENRGG